MKFYNTINCNSSKLAAKKFTQLITELAIRDTNYHCGSGLGGNNFQLLVLMALEHNIGHTNELIDLYRYDNEHTILIWDTAWLINTPMTDIRKKLDEVYPSIEESKKYMALAFESLASSNNLLITVYKHADQFPKLFGQLNGDRFTIDPALSNIDLLIHASVLCQELATCLDNKDMSMTKKIGYALHKLPVEMVLLSVRRYIGIERLVEHNLDEEPVFSKALNRVARLVA